MGIIGADIWSCPCVGEVSFFGFCCPLWFLSVYGDCVLPNKKFFLYPDMCDQERFQVKCVCGFGK